MGGSIVAAIKIRIGKWDFNRIRNRWYHMNTIHNITKAELAVD